MNDSIKRANKLIEYLYNSPTSFQATQNATSELVEAGFAELFLSDAWNIQLGGKYFVRKNNSSFVAFVAGEGNGIKAIAAHTDSPAFVIKPNPQINAKGHIKLNTAPYGGVIMHTWFDRPLAIAGRVFLKSENIYKPNEQLVNINKPLLIIPSLAIHLNREVNQGVKINPQVDTLPLAGIINEKLEENDYLLTLLASELNCQISDIIDFELKLYEYEKGTLLGKDSEFISSARLDDLWMVYAGLQAIKSAKASTYTKLLYCPDNEEIGSLTPQGADSLFLNFVLKRIAGEQLPQALANSYFISADLAHAMHPNYLEKDDLTSKVILGKGPALKYSPMQKYATTGKSAAIFKSLCQQADVPVQEYITRSDIMGGSTIGSFISANLACDVVDMGMGILAMHSIRELAHRADNDYVLQLFSSFFEGAVFSSSI